MDKNSNAFFKSDPRARYPWVRSMGVGLLVSVTVCHQLMFLAPTGFLYVMVPYYNAAASISDISDIICGISWGYLGEFLGISWGYLGDILRISWEYLGDILGIKWKNDLNLFSLLFWPQIISLGKYNRLETAYIEKFANMFYAEKKKK